MKRRAFKVLNFFAFNLLFFALYLNFIHKDKNVQEAIHASNAANYNTTVLVENTKTTEEKSAHSNASKTTGKSKEPALKLSFN